MKHQEPHRTAKRGMLSRMICLPSMVALMSMTPGNGSGDNAVIDLASTEYTLRLDVQALDGDDRPLPQAEVVVDHEGEELGRFKVAEKARLGLELDLGGLYGVSILCPGYVKKRFLLDARGEEPAKIIAGPFFAEVNLMAEKALGTVETDLFDMPYAMVVYSKEAHAFLVDEEYLRQMQQLEAALMLKVARAQRRGAQGGK